MLNEAHISLTGYVATQPLVKEVRAGVTNLTMRVAWTPRWHDKNTGEWVDGNTSYVTVTCWRKLAANVATCLRKGDPVVVKGRLSVRTFEAKDGSPRTVVEIDASSVGHDLGRGVAQFQRVRPQIGMTASQYSESMTDGGEIGGSLPAVSFSAADGIHPSSDAVADGASRPEDDLFDEAAMGELATAGKAVAAPF
jgi:single-strand DNA-binding protein